MQHIGSDVAEDLHNVDEVQYIQFSSKTFFNLIKYDGFISREPYGEIHKAVKLAPPPPASIIKRCP